MKYAFDQRRTSKEAMGDWLKKNQETVGLSQEGIDAESIIESFRYIQKALQFEASKNYDANFWTVAVYGSATTGRAMKGISDLDTRVNYKEVQNFILSDSIAKRISQYGFTSVSSVVNMQLDMSEASKLSPIIVFIKPSGIKVVIYSLDAETGAASVSKIFDLEL